MNLKIEQYLKEIGAETGIQGFTGSVKMTLFSFIVVDALVYLICFQLFRLPNILLKLRHMDAEFEMTAIRNALIALVVIEGIFVLLRLGCVLWSKGLSLLFELFALNNTLVASMLIGISTTISFTPQNMMTFWFVAYVIVIILVLLTPDKLRVKVGGLPDRVKAVGAGLLSIGIVAETIISNIHVLKQAYGMLILTVTPFAVLGVVIWVTGILRANIVYLWRVLPHQEELRQSLDVSEDIWYGPLWKRQHHKQK